MTSYFVDGTRPDDTGDGLSEATAKQTLQAGVNLLTATGDILNVKASAVYSIATAITFPTGPSLGGITLVRGYTATPGDGGKATVRATAAMTMFDLARLGIHLQDLDIDGNNVSGTVGVDTSATFVGLFRCLVRRMTGSGIILRGDSQASECEVTGCAGTAGIQFAHTSGKAAYCYVHDNTTVGILAYQQSAVIGCISANNTGASSDGIQLNDGYGILLLHNVCHGNGRDGIRMPSNYFANQPGVRNNILTSNGGYGLHWVSTPAGGTPLSVGWNAYRNNTSGATRSSIGAAATDVTLTADPFTDAVNGDFSLNNTAGGGAALRAAGFPGVLPGGTQGFVDIGAAQHEDAGGGGGGAVFRPLRSRLIGRAG